MYVTLLKSSILCIASSIDSSAEWGVESVYDVSSSRSSLVLMISGHPNAPTLLIPSVCSEVRLSANYTP